MTFTPRGTEIKDSATEYLDSSIHGDSKRTEGALELSEEWYPVQSSNMVEHMGVSKNRCTPKWMVYNGKPY